MQQGQKLIHIIGDGSSYDADIGATELFIRARDNKEDIIAQTAAFTHYLSGVFSYWGDFKEKLASPAYEEQLKSVHSDKFITKDMIQRRELFTSGIKESRIAERVNLYGISRGEIIDNIAEAAFLNYDNFTNFEDVAQSIYPLPEDEKLFTIKSKTSFRPKEFILENINNYENLVLSVVNEAQNEFEKTHVFQMSKFTPAYNFIAKLACFDPNLSLLHITQRLDTSKSDYMYLINGIGLFGFNTYLYALFSNVFLIGIPRGITEYDGGMACPSHFISHDLTHSKSISRSLSGFINTYTQSTYMNILSSAYYIILNSPSINTRKLKELLILYLWIMIHEYGLLDPINIFKEIYLLNITASQVPFIEEFKDEFLSFAYIIDDPESQRLISMFFPSVNVPDDRYYYTMVMLYGYAYMKSYIFSKLS